MGTWLKLALIIGIFGFLAGLMMSTALGADGDQPTQQSNKIFLNPFYRESMSLNTNYTYTISINPPDGISKVLSAIINFDVWLTPTVSFALWVDGKPCNNPSYLVHTTYADAGRGIVTFDCSNIITKAGSYTVHLRPTQANTGASTAWIDLTYMNNPIADLTIHGTEYMYYINSTAKIWLQLINSTGEYVSNAACFLDIFSPAMAYHTERAEMTNLNDKGVFYYNIVVPNEEGVYPTLATCYYYTSPGVINNYFNEFFIINGTNESGSMLDTQVIDGNFIRFKETITTPRIIAVGFNITNQKLCWNISESLLAGGSLNIVARFDSVAGDDLTLHFWNYTSNRWQALPNLFSEGVGWQTLSNTFMFDNISTTGLLNSSGGGLTLLVNDTSLTDGSANNFDIDYLSFVCDTFANPDWQETRGSSELHVSNLLNKIWEFDNRNLTYTPPAIAVIDYDNISAQVWNYPARNLTYINWSEINNYFNFNGLVINNTAIAEAVWSWAGPVSTSIRDFFATTIWAYNDRQLTYFPIVNATATVNISEAAQQFWNYPNRNLTYYLLNTNLTAQDVWNYGTRELTYYPSGNVSVYVNTSNIAQDVWNYSARYTHGEIVT